MRSLLLPYLRQSYEDMLRVTGDARLVVTSSFAYGATLAAEKRGLPYVNVALQPVMFTSAHDPPGRLQMPLLRAWCAPLATKLAAWALHGLDRRIGGWADPIHALRSQIGLPPATANPLLRGQFSPCANIGLYSRLLGDVQADFPAHTSVVGFSLYDRESGQLERLSEDLEQFLASGPAPLVFALGSQAVHSPGDFFHTSARVTRALGSRAVLVVGRAGEKALPPSPTANLFVVPYAPYSQLFPRASAIVHHGGIGTTGQALHSGRPQLVVPFWGDQHDNARRVVRLRVGRTIRRSSGSAARMALELNALLARPAYAQRAAQIAAVVRQEDGADRAVRIVGEVLRAHASAGRGASLPPAVSTGASANQLAPQPDLALRS
jgi:UDP:flavonoid glycosyltransferase YjiC (YdhE family)